MSEYVFCVHAVMGKLDERDDAQVVARNIQDPPFVLVLEIILDSAVDRLEIKPTMLILICLCTNPVFTHWVSRNNATSPLES